MVRHLLRQREASVCSLYRTWKPGVWNSRPATTANASVQEAANQEQPMTTVAMFKAARDSKRFRANQKVWVQYDHGNHLDVVFKWRGKGRYVTGRIDKFTNTSVGELREIEVGDDFAEFIRTFRNPD